MCRYFKRGRDERVFLFSPHHFIKVMGNQDCDYNPQLFQGPGFCTLFLSWGRAEESGSERGVRGEERGERGGEERGERGEEERGVGLKRGPRRRTNISDSILSSNQMSVTCS